MLVTAPASLRAAAPVVTGGQVHGRLPGVLERKCACGGAARIEIAIPDWRAFRKMAPSDQLPRLLGMLLEEEPDIAHLDSFVLDLARLRGGMANL